MMTAAMSRRAQELAARGEAFVTATVVRAQRPTSVEAGDVALVLGDGSIEGFVGGACAEHSVRALLAGGDRERRGRAAADPALRRGGRPADEVEDGAVTVQNPCLSGGAIEVFLEPVVPRRASWWWARRRSRARSCGSAASWGSTSSRVGGDGVEPRPDDLALVVAAHGRDELDALRRGLEAGLPYVGLVASRARGDGVVGELRGDGVPEELLGRIDVPAGIDIGARTPAEIALSILAGIVAVRREGRAPAAAGGRRRRRRPRRPPSTRSAA